MKRFTKAILPVLLFSTVLSGCGAAVDYSTLRINSKGGLTQTIVEDWDQEQYDKNELETQMHIGYRFLWFRGSAGQHKSKRFLHCCSDDLC